MKRLLGALAVSAVMLAPSATAGPVDVYRGSGTGATVSWISPRGDDGILIHYVSGYQFINQNGMQERAVYYRFPCTESRRGLRCFFSNLGVRRLKVDEFTIDPLLRTAHLKAHYQNREVNLAWQERGERNGPRPSNGFYEYGSLPRGLDAGFWVGVDMWQRATILGNVFDASFPETKAYADMYSYVSTGGHACVSLRPRCLP